MYKNVMSKEMENVIEATKRVMQCTAELKGIATVLSAGTKARMGTELEEYCESIDESLNTLQNDIQFIRKCPEDVYPLYHTLAKAAINNVSNDILDIIELVSEEENSAVESVIEGKEPIMSDRMTLRGLRKAIVITKRLLFRMDELGKAVSAYVILDD